MKKRKFKNRSFCQLMPDLIESEAFMSLSGKAVLVCLIRFHQKAYKKWTTKKKRGMKNIVITNNGEIVFTYGEAVELGIKSSRTFYKAIKELVQDKGFIDIAEAGNWYHKQPTKYAISERWKFYGTDRYEPVKINRSLPAGKGFQAKNKPKPVLQLRKYRDRKNKTRFTRVKPTDCTQVK